METSGSAASAALHAPWWRYVGEPSVLARGVRVALVVGTALAAINHGDEILDGSVTGREVLKILLTYCVPFCVSAFSAASALAASRSAGMSTEV
jgi:hypothetical protein